MKLFSATAYEEKFRDFLPIKSQWENLVKKYMKYSSHNSQGHFMRPIGITDDPAVLEEARELIRKWEKFARFADEYRSGGGAAGNMNEYTPIPFIVTGSRSISVNEGSAQSVTTILRERIIKGLNAKLKTLKREEKNTTTDIINIEFDLARFSEYPEGTMFRRRLAGYSDTLIISYGINNEDRTFRVGAWGALIDIRGLHAPINYFRKSREIISFYDLCTPIPCSLYSSGTLYLMDEVLRVKEENLVKNNPKKIKTKKKARTVEQVFSSSIGAA